MSLLLLCSVFHSQGSQEDGGLVTGRRVPPLTVVANSFLLCEKPGAQGFGSHEGIQILTFLSHTALSVSGH